jgi:LytS/YehU family sensor histidine kinase
MDGSLMITVLDDGPGLPDGWDEGSSAGVGLNNTRSRLRRLYGNRHRIELGNRAEGGLRLTLAIPFHTTGVLALPAA